MKKTIKTIFILALIIMAAGFVFCGIAAATGGTWNDFMKMVREGSFSFSWGMDDWSENATTLKDNELYYFEASEVRGLDISLDAGTLNVKRSHNDRVEVEVESGSAKVKMQLEDNVLTIGDDWRGVNFGIMGNRGVDITVALPEGMTLDTVDISVDAGDAVIEGGVLTTQAAFLSVNAGNLEFYGTVNGDLEADCNVGDLEFYGTVNGDIDADCDVGSITLRLSANEEDYNYSTSCDVGSIDVGAMSMSGFNKKYNVDNKARYKMVLNCDVGSITVDFE